jgi:hypothetical protein
MEGKAEMKTYYMKSEDGIELRVYGWPISDDRDVPAVFLGAQYFPLDVNLTMSPAEARRLATTLLGAAAAADGITD